MLPGDYFRDFEPGALIFDEGSVGHHLFVVVTGEVEIVRLVGEREFGLARLGHGEFFGEMTVIDQAPRSATARAGPDGARLALIDQAQFIYLVSHQPVFALMVLEALSRHLRETTELRLREVLASEPASAP